MFADYHVHTNYSNDSNYPMEDVVKDAIQLGLDEICFTDHVDYGVKRDWDDPKGIVYCEDGSGIPWTNVNYSKYVAQIQSLQQKYQGQITIKLGLEFGMQIHTIPQYEKLFARYPFDFIILSIHQIGDKELWTQDFQRGHTQAEYNMRYYEEILGLVQRYHNYSVLGHVDAIVRYDNAGLYPFENIKPILTEIFKTVIKDGKGIEINTSCYRYGLSDLTPSRDILRLYKELGGTVLTLGSDSHQKSYLAAHFKETIQEMPKLGFTKYCTYERMRPIFHDLPEAFL